MALVSPSFLLHANREAFANPVGVLMKGQLHVDLLQPDDPSWMLPWSSAWGQDQDLVVYSRTAPDRIIRALEIFLQDLAIKSEKLPSHVELAELLINGLSDRVLRCFAPFDALLLQLRDGESWAYLAPPEIEHTLTQLRFRKKHRW